MRRSLKRDSTPRSSGDRAWRTLRGALPGRVSLDAGRLQVQLQRTERALQHLSRLVEEMLEVNRYLLNRPLALRPEPVDLTALVFEVIQSEQSRQTELPAHRKIEFRLDMPGEPLWGLWDRVRVEQVLVDLIDNAVKYCGTGAHVRLRAL